MPAAHHGELDGQVVDLRRLGRAVRGEAEQQRVLARDECERIGSRLAQSALGELECAHATPTSTSRKRAGAQPCETRISWPGSPFPQSSNETSRHSEGEQTASQLPQKRGVTPP